ncbi:hypothetical protein RRG08_000474 [Elysia crispata]|uniref:Uncharacterized protein n=1 Tax=Elysia crispata TaxID=231223 RepID=A0AAE0YCH2_9GAST|nr:hypothetical protein RRG08_000474 [Elysia crispata]
MMLPRQHFSVYTIHENIVCLKLHPILTRLDGKQPELLEGQAQKAKPCHLRDDLSGATGLVVVTSGQTSHLSDRCQVLGQCSVHGLATMTVNINLDVRGETTEICSIALLIISVTVRGTREDRFIMFVLFGGVTSGLK